MPPRKIHNLLVSEISLSLKRRNNLLPCALVTMDGIDSRFLFEQPVVGHAHQEIKLLEVVQTYCQRFVRRGRSGV